MADEVTLLGELAPTKLTFIGLFPRVYPHVLCETVLACETHAALLTGKGLQTKVAAHVSCHGATLRKHLAADVARKRPCKPVRLLMLPQSGRIFVAFIAHCTAKAS